MDGWKDWLFPFRNKHQQEVSGLSIDRWSTTSPCRSTRSRLVIPSYCPLSALCIASSPWNAFTQNLRNFPPHISPEAWASDARGHSVSCAVLAGGTAAWLLTWTAPLLGMNPVTWAVLYALGVPSERAKAMVLGKAQESVKLWSFAAEWPGWAKSAIWRYRRSWSSSTATLETCTGVVLRGGIDQSRPLLVAWWFLALAVVVPVTPWVSRWLSLSKTAARKIFHALATAMFVPAIYLEVRAQVLPMG